MSGNNAPTTASAQTGVFGDQRMTEVELVKAVGQALVSARGHLQKVKDEIRQLEFRRSALKSTFTPKAYVRTLLSGVIEDGAAAYRGRLNAALLSVGRRHSSGALKDLADAGPVRQLATLGALATRDWQGKAEVDPVLIGSALCSLLGPAIEKALGEALDALEWPTDALTQEDLEAEDQRLKNRLLVLTDEARELEVALGDQAARRY